MQDSIRLILISLLQAKKVKNFTFVVKYTIVNVLSPSPSLERECTAWEAAKKY